MIVRDGQTLFDIAIQELGSTEAAFDLAMTNGLSLTDDLIPVQELELSEIVDSNISNYYKNKGINPATSIIAQAELINSVIDTIIFATPELQSNSILVLPGQSLFDIALQISGSVESAFDMSLLNLIAVTDDLVSGQELTKVSVMNKQILSYYSDKNIKPATFITSTESGGNTEGGIGTWAIETEFIIS